MFKEKRKQNEDKDIVKKKWKLRCAGENNEARRKSEEGNGKYEKN